MREFLPITGLISLKYFVTLIKNTELKFSKPETICFVTRVLKVLALNYDIYT
jgi:hypothetical protein